MVVVGRLWAVQLGRSSALHPFRGAYRKVCHRDAGAPIRASLAADPRGCPARVCPETPIVIAPALYLNSKCVWSWDLLLLPIPLAMVWF